MHQTGMLGFYNVPKWEEGEWRYDLPGFLAALCLFTIFWRGACVSVLYYEHTTLSMQ